MAQKFEPGQRLSYDGALCTVRYVGEVAGTTGAWLGVEWDDPARGKHDGTHKGHRYFNCRSKSHTAASFIRPNRPADTPRSFVAAVRDKYASEVTADHVPISSGREIVISGKVAQEVGFDKIRRKQAKLSELKIVILDAMCVGPEPSGKGEQSITDTCPQIMELDLSRNLFTKLGTVVAISHELKNLTSLRLNANRFQDALEDESLLAHGGDAFRRVKDLALDETLLSCPEIWHIAGNFEALTTLHASTNQLSSLSPVPSQSLLASNLTSLSMEYNDFTSLSDVASLAALTSLRNLHLKGNNISSITAPESITPSPVFAKSLHYVDLSYNQIASWAFVDSLPAVFPGMTSFRFSHNPIYDNPTFDNESESSSAGASGAKTTVTEEAYMITVGRLAALRSLNFSTISATDRTNAEMFYLSRIGRQLSSVPEGAEASVIGQHRRYSELCDQYGEPAVVRQSEINPAFLEARLIHVQFRRSQAAAGEGPQEETRAAQIPKSFDMYAVKGIAGKLFGMPPRGLRLIWETGEWDPVAGFNDEASDDSEDEGDGGDEVARGGSAGDQETQMDEIGVGTKAARWVKREVELKESPRQFGFCVDGSEAVVRVEPV